MAHVVEAGPILRCAEAEAGACISYIIRETYDRSRRRNMKAITANTLFYGDNLPILRKHIPDESIDLVYLDPPFNSNRSNNVLVGECLPRHH